jgi:sulfur transfer complex TusBCD TusB component (DsrH family)
VQEEFTDYTLWTVFQEEFYRFTVNNFKRMRSKLRAKLQIYLLKRGVYVAIYNNRYTLSKVLFDVL